MINIAEIENVVRIYPNTTMEGKTVLEMAQLIRDLAGALDGVMATINDTPETNGRPEFERAFKALHDAIHAGVTDHIADVRHMVGATEQSSAVAVPDGWHPIETAPKDNKRPLLLAQFSESGELHGLDWDGSWEPESESWEIPQVYYVWMTAMNYVDEPTHWMYQPDWFAAAPKQEGV